MSDLCGTWTGGRIDLHTGEVRAGAIWCKSWHCEHCAPIRQRQLMAQAAQGDPNKFITITSRYRPDEMSPAQAAQQLVHAWRMVIQRGKREKLFSNIQYIAVFELTKKGWPHLHILARCSFLHQAWLAERMQQYADSPVCHVRAVGSKSRAAWYVAKYTSKAPEKFQGCKRYWRTKGYDTSHKKSDKPLHDHFQGYCMDWNVRDVGALYTAHDYTLDWTSEHSFVAYPSGFDMHAFVRNKFGPKLPNHYKEHHRCASYLKTTPSNSTTLRPTPGP